MSQKKRPRIDRTSGTPIRSARDIVNKLIELGLDEQQAWQRYGRMKLYREMRSIK